MPPSLGFVVDENVITINVAIASGEINFLSRELVINQMECISDKFST